MTTVSQNLQANVHFGGNIDPSWNRSVSDLKDGLSGITRESEKLTSQQQKLTKKIKEGMRAGKDISDLRDQYVKLDQQIRKTTADQEDLNKALSRAERMERWRGRGQKVISGAGGAIGSVARWGSAGIIAGAAGAVASPLALNQETAQQAGMARSYGVGIETYQLWEGVARQAGLNAENMGDLFEEYRNKVSEHKLDATTGALFDAFPVLGFKAGDFAGKNNQQQVEEIFSRLLNMKDEQRAAGIADSIFGGEGNKLLTFMRMSGKTYAEMMEEQKRYNMVTQEGADGAMKGNAAFNNLWAVFTTGAQEIAGVTGNELTPALEKLTQDLATWFKGGGIEKIKSLLINQLYPAIMEFIKGVIYVGKVIFAVAKKLSWLLPDEKSQQDNKQKLLTQVAAGNSSPEMIAAMASELGLREWYDKEITPEKRQQLQAQWKASKNSPGGTASPAEQQKLMDIVQPAGEDDFSGDGLKALLNPSLKGSLAGTGAMTGRDGPQLTQHNETTFEIYQQPGESQDALAQRIADTNKNQDMYNGQNILGDLTENWGG